jgi:hypothetical protein
MTITRARTNKYGPASLDIQFEQNADFYLELDLKHGAPLLPWNLLVPGAVVEACFTNTWNPIGAVPVPFVVTVLDPVAGKISVSLPKADVNLIQFAMSPAKLPAPIPLGSPSRFIQLGGWTLSITESGSTQRLLDGDVQMDRDPCLS